MTNRGLIAFNNGVLIELELSCEKCNDILRKLQHQNPMVEMCDVERQLTDALLDLDDPTEAGEQLLIQGSLQMLIAMNSKKQGAGRNLVIICDSIKRNVSFRTVHMLTAASAETVVKEAIGEN